MQQRVCKACKAQGAARSRTPSTKHKGPAPRSGIPCQPPAQVAVCTPAAAAAAALHEAQQQQQHAAIWSTLVQQRQQTASWNGPQQQHQQSWQHGQQVIPGRTLHSLQTDELLWMLHASQTVQQQQQQVPTETPRVTSATLACNGGDSSSSSSSSSNKSISDPVQHNTSNNNGSSRSMINTVQHSSSSSSSSSSGGGGGYGSGSSKSYPNARAVTKVQALRSQQQERQQQQRRQLSDAALLVQMMKGCHRQQQLLLLTAAHVSDVDAVAAAAAVVYYAKLVVPDPPTAAAAAAADRTCTGQQQQQQLSSSNSLPVLLRQLLLLHMPGFKARQCANTLYALGRMHCRDKPLVDLLLRGLLQNLEQQHTTAASSSSSSDVRFLRSWQIQASADLMSQLKPQEVANIAWGLGRLRVWPCDRWMQRFYEVSAVYLRQQQQHWQRQQQQHWEPCRPRQQQQQQQNWDRSQQQQQQQQRWEHCRPRQQQQQQHWEHCRPRQQQQQQQHWEHCRPRQQQQQQQVFTPQELANMVWGLGRLHATPPDSWLLLLLPLLDQQQLQGFSPQQLSNMIWGLAQMGGPRPRVQDHVDLVTNSNSSSRGVSSSRRRKGLGVTLPAGFLSKVCKITRSQLSGFSSRELANLIWGMAQLQQQQQQQQQQPGQEILVLQVELAESACWQLVGGFSSHATAAAAAAADHHVLAAAGGGKHFSSFRLHNSSSSICIADPAVYTLIQPKRGYTWLQQQQQQQVQQQQQHVRQRQQQVRKQQQQRQRHFSYVRPSQLAKVLGSYRTLLLLYQGYCAAASHAQQQQQQRPKLPQQLLHQLAGLLSVYCPSISSTTSSSSSSVRQQHRSLPDAESAGFCQTLLLLAQLGYTPNPRYLSAALEVLHDKLHVLNPRDFEVITQCLVVLGYMPAKPWVRDYLKAAQPRFSKMRPEGLARLLAWVLQAEQWFSTRHRKRASHNRAAHPAAAAAESMLKVQQHHMGNTTCVEMQPPPAAAAVVATAAAGEQLTLLPYGVCIRSGVLITAEWISDLIQHLRSKVACRAAATTTAAAAGSQGMPGLRSTTESKRTAAAPGLGSSSSSMYSNVGMLDEWVLQGIQRHGLVMGPMTDTIDSS